MKTLNDHLQQGHKESATSHTVIAKSHRTLAEHYSDLSTHFAKADMGNNSEMAECFQKISEGHRVLAEHHDSEASRHSEYAKTFAIGGFRVGKSEDAGDLEKRFAGLMPTPVSAINPLPAGVRPVARAGQPDSFGKVASGCESFVSMDE